MEILTVKEQLQGGYLINGSMNVPEASGNRHYSMIQEWIAEGNIPELAETTEETSLRIYSEVLREWKADREILVNNIEVTYNFIVYQGDEKSQDRMSRAINGLPDDATTVSWVAKDNSENNLTKLDLQSILFDAGNQQSAIWSAGRPTL